MRPKRATVSGERCAIESITDLAALRGLRRVFRNSSVIRVKRTIDGVELELQATPETLARLTCRIEKLEGK